MSVALLFPGQGAQRPGMLGRIPDTSTARDTITEALQICRELDPSVDLDNPGSDTVATQLSLVRVGVGCSRALTLDAQLPVAFVAGHSVGAFSAAVTAGVLTLRDALATVFVRATSMRAACTGDHWGMAAISGLTVTVARSLVSELSTTAQPLWVANVNNATQIVVAGTVAALDAAEAAARRLGARNFERLDVEIASHGPVQEPTVTALRTQFASIPIHPPTRSYITNVGGRSVRSAQGIVDDLIQSVARTVQWYDGIRLMHELGVHYAIEVGPGHTLSRLVGAAVPEMPTASLEDQSLSVVIAQARR